MIDYKLMIRNYLTLFQEMNIDGPSVSLHNGLLQTTLTLASEMRRSISKIRLYVSMLEHMLNSKQWYPASTVTLDC